ncbi:hypothetical protein FRX31_019489 [Thalictrum thalictroides]|uniref:Uncharacterized protein n=1 Tax=Thalictrum thalictroides TaxID=46969 RepID=A0A7J6W3N1_THATH|nr:hypothetical protein FRX31_019489 [Thalictrum thalictroides]
MHMTQIVPKMRWYVKLQVKFMADERAQSPKRTSLPPKRGQVIARIFGVIFKPVVMVASKAAEGFQVRKNGGRGGSSAASSAYNSEGITSPDQNSDLGDR